MKPLTILALLGAFVAAGRTGLGAEKGVTPSPTAPPPGPAAKTGRPEPPSAPIKYLQAGAKLFNEGRYDEAAKYLAAAHAYRDRLAANERVVLDVYREKLGEYREALRHPAPAAVPASPAVRRAGAAVTDPGVVTASTSAARSMEPAALPELGLTPFRPVFGRPEAGQASADPSATGAEARSSTEPAGARTPRLGMPGGTDNWRGTPDLKQKARWLLQQAREHIHKKKFDAAEAALDEARALNVGWGYFDDTPKKVAETLARARDEAEKKALADSKDPGVGQHRDRRTAKAKIHDARAALAAGRIDEAEQIASEVQSWHLRYSPFDDTPDKLAASLAQARRAEALRTTESLMKSYMGADPGRRQPKPVAPGSTTPGATTAPADR